MLLKGWLVKFYRVYSSELSFEISQESGCCSEDLDFRYHMEDGGGSSII